MWLLHLLHILKTLSIKLKKQLQSKVLHTYICTNHVLQDGEFASEKTIEMGRLAVETGSWILYEVENGEFNITYRPEERKTCKRIFSSSKDSNILMMNT